MNDENPSTEQVLRALASIESSPHFSAPRSRALVDFVVRESLAGRADRLKAYSIATLLFGRDESFDPQTDSIVRVEASKARRLLELYYLGEGAGDSVEISLPRGSYQPQFRFRHPPSAQLPPATQAAVAPRAVETEEYAAPVSAAPGDKLKRRLSIVGAAALAILCVVLLIDRFLPRDVEAGHRLGPSIVLGQFDDALEVQPSDREFDLRKELAQAFSRFGRHQVFERGDGSVPALHYEVTARYFAKSKIAVSVVFRPSGEIVWSRTIDLSDKDREKAIEAIATPVASQYGAIFSHERRFLARAPDSNGEACIIRTLDRLRSGEPDPDPACLEALIAARPGSAIAQSILGRVYAARYIASGVAADLARARDAARRGEELGPLNERARLASMEVRYWSDLKAPDPDALAELSQMNPYNADTLARIGRLLVLTGRYEEGGEYLRRAGAFLPLSETDRAMMFVADWVRGRSSALSAAVHFQTNASPLVVLLAIVAALEVGDQSAAQEIADKLTRSAPEIASRTGDYLQRWGFEQPVRIMVASRLQKVRLGSAR